MKKTYETLKKKLESVPGAKEFMNKESTKKENELYKTLVENSRQDQSRNH